MSRSLSLFLLFLYSKRSKVIGLYHRSPLVGRCIRHQNLIKFSLPIDLRKVDQSTNGKMFYLSKGLTKPLLIASISGIPQLLNLLL